MTMIVAGVVAVLLLVGLTVWKSRTTARSGPGQFGDDTLGPRNHGGPTGSDRLGGGFGSGL